MKSLNLFFSLTVFLALAVSGENSYAHKTEPYTGVNPKTATELPSQLEGVGIQEQLGKDLDLSLPVTDENGQKTTLGAYFDGQTPVILSPVYFSCPGLCNFHLNGLTDALKQLDWSAGDKFKVIALSFDSRENSALAFAKKATYMKVYDRPGTENGWHFLTLDESAVKAFTQKVGFKFKWNEESKEWSHASAAIVATPGGRISRYLPGILFEPRDVKLALNEATAGKTGNFIEGLVLYCFQYNPHASKYTIAAFKIMKLGGGIMVLFLALWLMPIWIRTRRQQNTAGS